MKLNNKEIKHLRDLVLADALRGKGAKINESILIKLDEQLSINAVMQAKPEKVCLSCHEKKEELINSYWCNRCYYNL